MTTRTYVRLVADLLSGDPPKVRSANRELLAELVPKEKYPDLVLVEVEDRVVRQHKQTQENRGATEE